MNDLNLNNTWIFYDHIKCEQKDYESSTNTIAKCSTIYEFWNCYEKLPKPSVIFYNKEFGKPYCKNAENPKREISSISVFKEGIFPKWEHEKNKYGGEIEYKKFNNNSLDSMWLKLCIHCLSEQFNKSHLVTGFRIVDNSIIEQNKPMYRFELWFSDISYAQEILQEFKSLLNIYDEKIIIKKH